MSSTILFVKNWIQTFYLRQKYIVPFVKGNLNRSANWSNTICLFCQPRTGSTWLAEILLQIENSCFINEPLWRGEFKQIDDLPSDRNIKIPQAAELNFHFIQPIHENEIWEEANQLIYNIINGKIASKWFFEGNDLPSLKNTNTHVVKFNFAQLLLHWYVKNFKTPAILLLRHPCAVVASQLELPHLNKFGSNGIKKFPEFRNREVYNQYDSILENIHSTEGLLAFRWAIQVKHSLYHPDNNTKWLTVAYENLVCDFENEAHRIFNYIDHEIPSTVHKMRLQPSFSTDIISQQKIKEGNQLDSWKFKLNKKQIRDILNVVNWIGVDLYSVKTKPNNKILYNSHNYPQKL